MPLPQIAGFIPASLVDWDGRVASVVVLQGCNFRCPFCHSAEFVRPGPPEREVPWEAVLGHLVSNAGWIDGVVVSGGEPTMTGRPALEELLGMLRDLELPVKLDTNGSAPARLRELVEAGLVEHVAMDVKAPLEVGPWALATGLDVTRAERALEAVRESLDYLKSLEHQRTGRVSYELRTTLVPSVFGEDVALEALAIELSWARRWFLQGFRPLGCLDPETERLPETDPERLERWASRLREVAPGCRARGASRKRPPRLERVPAALRGHPARRA